MSPEQLLRHHDLGQLWSVDDRAGTQVDLAAAYQQALSVRQLRLQPVGVVTTGTWTDAFAIAPGERWGAQFSAPWPGLTVTMQ